MRALETHNSNHGTQTKLYREVVFFHSLKLRFITEKHRRFGRCFFCGSIIHFFIECFLLPIESIFNFAKIISNKCLEAFS